MPAGNQHRAGLSGAEVLLANLSSMLARRDPERDVSLVLHHHAVGPAIDPVRLRIAHDHEIVGADVAAAVVLVQERHRDFSTSTSPSRSMFSNTGPLATVLCRIGRWIFMPS